VVEGDIFHSHIAIAFVVVVKEKVKSQHDMSLLTCDINILKIISSLL